MGLQKYLLLLLSSTVIILAGCSQTPEIYHARGKPVLAAKIKKAIDTSGHAHNIGVLVYDPLQDTEIYRLNAEKLYTPASNNKIFTSSAAFYYLGQDFRFVTSVSADSSEYAVGHCRRLVLKAGGDPDFSLASLDSLAELIAADLVAIDTIVIDNTILDATFWGEGWMWDEGSWWYAAPIDAMSLNDNCIDFDIAPGEEGQPPAILVNPDTKYITINNLAVTTADTSDLADLEIVRHWWDRSNTFDITGDILVTEERDTLYRNIHDPALFTGHVFNEILARKGVETGSVVLDTIPAGFTVVAKHYSQALPEVIKNFLKVSDNLSGELLVKTLGRLQSGRQGNWHNGLTAVKTFLADQAGIDTTAMYMADGSGVSRYNLTSPEFLVAALKYNYRQDYRRLYLEALPIAGIDGTLENRMDKSPAKGHILAKTGTLSGASSLSGIAYRRNGDPLIFSIMTSGYVGSSGPARRLQDEICDILVTY